MNRVSKLKRLVRRHAARHYEAIGIVVIFIAFMGAAVYASTGESFPPPPLSWQEIYFIRVPSSSPLTP